MRILLLAALVLASGCLHATWSLPALPKEMGDSPQIVTVARGSAVHGPAPRGRAEPSHELWPYGLIPQSRSHAHRAQGLIRSESRWVVARAGEPQWDLRCVSQVDVVVRRSGIDLVCVWTPLEAGVPSLTLALAAPVTDALRGVVLRDGELAWVVEGFRDLGSPLAPLDTPHTTGLGFRAVGQSQTEGPLQAVVGTAIPWARRSALRSDLAAAEAEELLPLILASSVVRDLRSVRGTESASEIWGAAWLGSPSAHGSHSDEWKVPEEAPSFAGIEGGVARDGARLVELGRLAEAHALERALIDREPAGLPPKEDVTFGPDFDHGFLNFTFDGGFDGAFAGAGISAGRGGYSLAPGLGVGDFVYIYGVHGYRPEGPGFSSPAGFDGAYTSDAHQRVGTGLRLVVHREERFALYTALELARLSQQTILSLRQSPADLRVGGFVIEREGWGFAAAAGVRLPLLAQGRFQIGLLTELRIEHARWGDPKLRVSAATREDAVQAAQRLAGALREDFDATGWAPAMRAGAYLTF